MSSRRVEILLMVTLATSVAWKAAANRTAPAPDGLHFAATLSAVLASKGFNTRVEGYLLESPTVSAKKRDCEIWATEYSPHGISAVVVAERAAFVGPLRYAFRGQLYDAPPKLSPLLAFYWWREVRRIGASAPRFPLVAVAGTSGCDLSTLPWKDIAALER